MKIQSILKKKIQTIKDLQDRLKELMAEHIGNEHYITKMELFKELFGNPEKYSEIQQWFLWDKVRKAMNWLRRTSYCFIACKQVADGIFGYFVIKDYKDAEFYLDRLDNAKKRIEFMKKRAMKAVEEKFFEQFLDEIREEEKDV